MKRELRILNAVRASFSESASNRFPGVRAFCFFDASHFGMNSAA
ncbi:hypothetical protein [Caballeronia glebae]|nr:hypothetical protein [Caballeronia glebae]